MAQDQDRDDPEDNAPTPRRPTAAERRQHAKSHPYGVPVVRLPDDPPAAPDDPDDPLPFDWAELPDRRDAECLRRSGRDPSYPVVPAELSQIVRRVTATLRAEFRAMLARAPVALSEELERRMDRLERDFAPVQRLGKWAAGVALGAALALGAFLYRRGADEQRVADEIKEVRDHAAHLQLQLDSLLRPIKEPRP